MRRGERKHMASLALCADAQDDTHELEGQNVDGAARLLRAHIASTRPHEPSLPSGAC